VPYTVLQSLELALMASEPDIFLPKYLHSVDDVGEHRSRLRSCAYSDFAIEHLADLVWGRINQRRRKNLIYGLQAIKWILRHRISETQELPPSVVDRLFELYQCFVFDRLDKIRWCVSAILKDKMLRDVQVRWLIEQHQASEHIVNRLLRYPQFEPQIASWARFAIDRPEFAERSSELIGRLINNSLPPEADRFSPTTLLWGIYYSSSKHEDKQRLLREVASLDTAHVVIEISTRLGMYGIIRELRDRAARAQ
jgi:hypothetical protein